MRRFATKGSGSLGVKDVWKKAVIGGVNNAINKNLLNEKSVTDVRRLRSVKLEPNTWDVW